MERTPDKIIYGKREGTRELIQKFIDDTILNLTYSAFVKNIKTIITTKNMMAKFFNIVIIILTPS